MRILIIEDDPDIIAGLFDFLEPLGYVLDVARNGVAGLASAATGHHDVIMLDLSLPGMDGIEVCRRLRQEHRIAVPVLILSARDTEHDKVAGFAAGADDYLGKPYSLAELDARLKALVRRARNEHVQHVLAFDDVRFDLGTGQAWRAGKRIVLTPTGYKLLAVLLRHAPNLVTREILEHEVWGDNPPDSDALRTHIHALRHALDKPFSRPLLKTVPGSGYRLMRDEGR